MIGYYFGVPYGSVWGNLLTSAICTGIAWWRLHRQSARQHVRVLAQAAEHHFERLAQAEGYHKVQVQMAQRNHQQLLDRGDVQHEALKAAIERAAGGDRM